MDEELDLTASGGFIYIWVLKRFGNTPLMVRLFAYMFVALFVSLFVSIGDANAHANHRHTIEKTTVETIADHKTKTSEQVPIPMDCPFSCCQMACGACCTFTSQTEFTSHISLNTNIQKFEFIQERLSTHISSTDSPPPRN